MNDAKIDEVVEILCEEIHRWWKSNTVGNEQLKVIWRKDMKEALIKALDIVEDENVKFNHRGINVELTQELVNELNDKHDIDAVEEVKSGIDKFLDEDEK